MRLPLILILSYALSGLSFAQSTTVRPPLLPPEKQPVQSNKKEWVEHMRNELPKKLCEPDQYFVKCFQVTPKECLEFTQLLVDACINSAVIGVPEMVETEQGEYWGKMIGRCSYDLYVKHMANKKRDLKECKPMPQTKSNP